MITGSSYNQEIVLPKEIQTHIDAQWNAFKDTNTIHINISNEGTDKKTVEKIWQEVCDALNKNKPKGAGYLVRSK